MVEIVTSQRSAIESSKQAAARMVATACRLAGFEVEHTGSYPGWKPEPNSEIVRKLQAVHEEALRRSGEADRHARRAWSAASSAKSIPACRWCRSARPSSIPHSPNERVQISSVESFWKYLKAVLERI